MRLLFEKLWLLVKVIPYCKEYAEYLHYCNESHDLFNLKVSAFL